MLAYSIEVWTMIGGLVSAVGTVGAVVVALAFALRDGRRDKERQRLEIEQQALAVAGVVVVEARYEDPEDWYPDVDDMPDALVTIHNFSDEPILFPRLELFADGDGTVDWDVWVAPQHLDTTPMTQDVLAAGGKLQLTVTLKTKTIPKTYPEVLRPVIGFTDRHNQRWRRRHSDPPYRVPAGDTTPVGGPEWYRKAVDPAPGTPAVNW